MTQRRGFVLAGGVTVAIFATAAAGLHIALDVLQVHLAKKPINARDNLQFHTLPSEFESWAQLGPEPPPLPPEIVDVLGTPNYLSRRYRETDAPPGEEPEVFELHCAYYTGMPDAVPHVPERCFTAGGLVKDSSAALVPIPLDLSRFPVDGSVDPDEVDPELYGEVRRGRLGPTSNTPGLYVRMPFQLEDLRLRVTRFLDPNDRTVYAGYFFLANGWAVADRTQVRQLAFDLTADYAYYAKIQFTSLTADSPEDLAAMAADFLNEALPELMRRTPDWVEVLGGRFPPPDQAAQGTTRPRRGTKEWDEWRRRQQRSRDLVRERRQQ